MNRRSLGILFTALALSLAAFSSWAWWRHWSSPLVLAVIRPDFSAEGVVVGAPVRISGVPVGEIESVGLSMDSEGRLRPELRIAMDPVSLEDHGFAGRFREGHLHDEVSRGLVARLVAVSPASGMLQVELHWEKPPVQSPNLSPDEIPAVGGTMQQKYERLAAGFEGLAQRDLVALLQKLEDDIDRWMPLSDPRLAAELNAVWVAKSERLAFGAKALAEGPGLAEASRACRSLREAVESADASVSPESIALVQMRIADASAALGSFAASLDASRGVVEGASADLAAAFRVLSEAARSLRAKARGLTDEPIAPVR